MLIARQRLNNFRPLAAATPYVEKDDRRENRVDAALLNAWGGISPYLLSGIERNRLDRLVKRAEDHEQKLIGLSDAELRQAADDLRTRLLSASGGADEVALAFAMA